MSSDVSCWLSRTGLMGRIDDGVDDGRRRTRGNARRLIVGRGRREGPQEARSFRRGNRRIVEPGQLANRTEDRRDRPLATRIGKRDACRFVERVVTGDDAIVPLVPAVVAGTIRRCAGRRKARPPPHRIDSNGIELDAVAGRPLSAPRDVEGHAGFPVDLRKLEAAFVEMELSQRLGAARRARRAGRTFVQDGIAGELVPMAAAVDQRFADAAAEEVADRRRRTRPQIEHAAPCRMPRRRSGDVDIDVILERHERPEDAEDVDLRCRRCFRIGVSLFVRTERALVRMRARVCRSDASNRRVGEDDRAVSGSEVATVKPLTDQQSLVIGVIVVGGVQLVEATVVPGERDGNAANPEGSVAAHPERRVRSGHEKLGARWRRGGRCGRLAGAARGCAQRDDQEAAHRWQIYCVARNAEHG